MFPYKAREVYEGLRAKDFFITVFFFFFPRNDKYGEPRATIKWQHKSGNKFHNESEYRKVVSKKSMKIIKSQESIKNKKKN